MSAAASSVGSTTGGFMTESATAVAAVIARNLGVFARPGVLSVRAGYLFTDGWPRGGRPAIVVTVADASRANSSLPEAVEGVPVEVRPASDRKRAALTGAATWPLGSPPDSGAPPVLADELRPDGSAVPPARFEVAAAAAGKPQLSYTPPEGVPLSPVTGPVTVQACASPDAGWPVLQAFLAGVQQTLTVGLYDWTSAHVLDWFTQHLTGKTVRLVLDHPAKNPTADQTDEQTVTALRSALDSDLSQAWALERADPLAAAWIFPSAYHIKVAVADSARVWLSSGNWNNSNQPDIDPAHNAVDATAARSRDRDWHVVIDSPQLAATFEAYLRHDLTVAAQHQQTPAQAAAELDAPALAPVAILPAVESPPFAQFFAPTTVTDTMTITPLLTPDPGSYAAHVQTLIASAQHTLYLQFQYIELPTGSTPASPAFTALVAAVIDRQRAGVDVRIVMSQYETKGYLEQLITAGLDVTNGVRIQPNVHNKGIVVDGTTVLVSSQNWSNAG